MMLFGEEAEKINRLNDILNPYVRLVDGYWVYELDGAPEEVLKAYEEYLAFKEEYKNIFR